jgi:hypothetical protein
VRLAAVLVTAFALAPAAAAATAPPIGLKVVKLTPYKQAKSCTVPTRARHGAAAIARRLHPVACEQPPRARLLDLSDIILLAP